MAKSLSTMQTQLELRQVAEEATKIVANAASEAVRTIANAASEASKVVSANAADAAKSLSVKGVDDHDILVELKVKMEALKEDIKDLKDGTTKRISDLEADKLNVRDSYSAIYKDSVEKVAKDHEDRIRKSENSIAKILTWGSAILIIIGILEFVLIKWF